MDPGRRRSLLAAAAAEFAQAGYQRASLNRVIGECGMSKSSFYHYFDSKEALFDAVVDECGTALLDALDPPDPADLESGFWEAVSDLTGRLAELSQRSGEDRWSVDFGRIFALEDAPPGGALDRARGALDTWLTAALAAGRRSGAVRDDLPAALQAHLALVVLRAMDEWTLRHLDTLTAAEIEQVVTAQLDALRRLLAA